MNRFLPVMLFSMISISSYAQRKKMDDAFYMWNKDWVGTTTTDSAAYFGRLIQESDTSYRWIVYRYFGPMISSQHFSDKELRHANGINTFYYPNGYMDSTGNVVENHVDGDWHYYNNEGKGTWVKTFAKGKLISKTDHSGDTTKDIEPLPGEEEASFPRGLKAWQQYLYGKLTYPDRAMNQNIQGDVVIRFIVDTTGKVTGSEIFKSLEFSLDESSMTLIQKSPTWIPSTKDGVKVKGYKLQPIHYRLQR